MMKWSFKKIFLLICLLGLGLGMTLLGLTVFYPAQLALAHLTPSKNVVYLQELSTTELSAGQRGSQLDSYLEKNEAAFAFKPGTDKKIFWAHEDKRVTELSFVYLHGFSATRQEISPVVENLGVKLGANVFFTRLTGHGLDNEAMGSARTEDYVRDADEALAIGRLIGKKVVLVGMSTGSALALHLAQNNPSDVVGLILLAANFQPANPMSWLTAGPAGAWMARAVMGRTRTWQPVNSKQAYYWTTTYPSVAVHEMMDLLKYANALDLEKIKIPVLMMYTDKDVVVSLPLIKSKFLELGSPNKKLIRMNSIDHVMAGDIMGHDMNGPVSNEILAFLSGLGYE